MAKTTSRRKSKAHHPTSNSRTAGGRRPKRQTTDNQRSARALPGDMMTPPLEDETISTPPSVGAAPVALEPDQSVHLQTWTEQPTTLHIENTSDYIGEVVLQWGAHSEEIDHCNPGTTDLAREFGGVPVHITNTGNVSLRVSAM